MHAVARLADGERLEAVAVDLFEKGSGVRALDVDLAERRHVTDADGGADRVDLACHGLEPVALAGAREIARPQPQPGLDEHGALLARPSV